jgi:hypothetical protein
MTELCEKTIIIGVPWHIGHQYSLCEVFANYYMVPNMHRSWVKSSRPFPKNATMIASVAEAERKIDEHCSFKQHHNPSFKKWPVVALLHVDQDSLHDPRKKSIFQELKKSTSHLPQIVINHGVPVSDSYSKEECIEKMEELVGDTAMVVNSHQAAKEWGMGTPIIHGYDPEEFNPRPFHEKEAKVITFVSKGGMKKMYQRGFMGEIRSIFKCKGRNFDWISVDSEVTNFEDYKERLSRSAIYLNAYPNSPMPRSRTEAMMSRCLIATCKDHGGEDMVNNESGVLFDFESARAIDVAERLMALLNDYELMGRMADKGYEHALKMFSMQRYKKDWSKMIEKVI